MGQLTHYPVARARVLWSNMRSFLLLAAISLTSVRAATVNLIQNGDFESGLSGWTVLTQTFGIPGACSDPFALQTTGTPSCGSVLADPIGGGAAVYASARFDPGSNSMGDYNYILEQDFLVPSDPTSATLTTAAVQFTGPSVPSVVDSISLNDPRAVCP